ncbi:MAG: hypothetical protein GC191_09570 [Azospirillum sp.]|nr:hypothetical protein [Azospirillum sp.]
MSRLPTLDQVAAWPAERIAALPAPELAQLLARLDAQRGLTKTAATRLAEGLELKYGSRIAGERQAQGKPLGRIRIMDAGVAVVHEVDKQVVWDQDKLAALAKAGLAEKGYDPAELLSTTYTVSEKAYAAWPSPLRVLFEPARTERPKGSKWEMPIAKPARPVAA